MKDYLFAAFVIALSGVVLAGLTRFAISAYFETKQKILGSIFGPDQVKEN
jgi:hypothetical protein